MIKETSGVKYIASVPEGETIIGMTNFQGRLMVCSNKSLYELINEELCKVEIVNTGKE